MLRWETVGRVSFTATFHRLYISKVYQTNEFYFNDVVLLLTLLFLFALPYG